VVYLASKVLHSHLIMAKFANYFSSKRTTWTVIASRNGSRCSWSHLPTKWITMKLSLHL